ncbi:hypothetical protein [Gloeobacter morelensis]|uniref:Glycine zipper domain-containing protein n=1 Tax=Gloeobacter morelensis MG652769 TaxID=2781736 RepID=A0ABY3PMM3_9CYAN|nr:hypothetical protein [Gloeobacter morelensis]UFP94870.1 hypothetical protein ISF26_01055 [Gloeobacter morelensis MG652769]
MNEIEEPLYGEPTSNHGNFTEDYCDEVNCSQDSYGQDASFIQTDSYDLYTFSGDVESQWQQDSPNAFGEATEIVGWDEAGTNGWEGSGGWPDIHGTADSLAKWHLADEPSGDLVNVDYQALFNPDSKTSFDTDSDTSSFDFGNSLTDSGDDTVFQNSLAVRSSEDQQGSASAVIDIDSSAAPLATMPELYDLNVSHMIGSQDSGDHVEASLPPGAIAIGPPGDSTPLLDPRTPWGCRYYEEHPEDPIERHQREQAEDRASEFGANWVGGALGGLAALATKNPVAGSIVGGTISGTIMGAQKGFDQSTKDKRDAQTSCEGGKGKPEWLPPYYQVPPGYTHNSHPAGPIKMERVYFPHEQQQEQQKPRP